MADRNQDAAWETLLDYRFAQEIAEPGWFRLHSRMKAALRRHLAADQEAFARSHSGWQAYWNSRALSDVDDLAALAWSHDFVLKPDEARQSWSDRAEKARHSAKMASHHDLLDWWSPTEIEGSPPRDQSEAAALVALGTELNRATLGNPTSNQSRAIACYEAALRVYTEADRPAVWAMTQHNLGAAYYALPTGDRDANLRAAVACDEAALRIYKETSYPERWSIVRSILDVALAEWNERELLED